MTWKLIWILQAMLKFFQNIRLPIFLRRTHSEVLFEKGPREDAAHL